MERACPSHKIFDILVIATLNFAEFCVADLIFIARQNNKRRLHSCNYLQTHNAYKNSRAYICILILQMLICNDAISNRKAK